MGVNIVIIGAGPGGATCCQVLAKRLTDANITIVERREFQYHAVGTPRALVDESYTPKLFIPYTKAFPSNVRLITGIAEKIESKQLVVRIVDNGVVGEATEVIPFDYLIIATGGKYVAPFRPSPSVLDRESVSATLATIRKKVAGANSILIVGGGAVGIEVAGEISAKYPEKKITLMDGNKELLAKSNFNPKLRKKIMAEFSSRKVEVLLNERPTSRLTEHRFEQTTLTAVSGKEITTDIQLLCTGMIPDVSLVEALDPDLIEGGRIRVKSNFQIDSPDYSHYFVVGDASNHPTPKMEYWAKEQAKHLGSSLASHIKYDRALTDFIGPDLETIVIPMGPHGGVTHLPYFGGITLGNFATRMLKSKDYFAGMKWGALNAKLPN